MKKQELEELLEQHKTEDGINIDDLSQAINDNINLIRDKYVEKAKADFRNDVNDEVKNEFLKEYGFDNVDQFSAFVKTSKASATETSEALQRTQKEYADYKDKYSTLENDYNQINSQLTKLNNEKVAKSIGIKDDMLDYALFEATKQVNEDNSLEDILNSFKESKPILFGEESNSRVKVGKEPKPNEERNLAKENALDLYNRLKKSGKVR